MSYLLTEIALDMLGYWFYDANGTFHITDFQTVTSNNDAASIVGGEQSLEEIIYSKAVDQTNAPDTDSDDCVEISNTIVEPRISVEHHELMQLNIKESVDKEFDALCAEIEQNKIKYTEDKINGIKKRDKTSKGNPKDLLGQYEEQEKTNIRAEAEMLDEFLKCVEEQLEEANPNNFKEHKRYRMLEYM